MTRRLVSAVSLTLQLTVLTLYCQPRFCSDYTNDFAVEIDGDTSVADLVASVYGFTLVRQVRQLENVYHFTHTDVSHRSKRSADDLLGSLNSDPNVRWVEQQRLLSREKRSWETAHKRLSDWYSERDNSDSNDKSSDDKSKTDKKNDNVDNEGGRESILAERTSGAESFRFNDPHFKDQWYLINRGQTGGTVGYDLNVLPVWREGITGEGVVVSILDDGVEHGHPDLKHNYDPKASADLNDRNDKDNDPTPDLRRPDNNHGTRCAGEVAAAANNSNCCVGVAYNAKIGGVRMLDGPVTDLLEAEAITYNNQHVDIYSASWGPTDDGKTMEGPHRYCLRAFLEGVQKGRNGLGSIFVWATGNGGLVNDYCSCDGYVSSVYTLAVGSVMERGLSTYFSEICPATMAVVFAGGSHVIPGDVNYKAPEIKVVTTDVSGKCTTGFQGTSSAAPLAAGCLALVLEANPNLTWRDVQNIVVETARIPNSEEGGWIVNGGGYHVNHRFGFGVLDCARMVEAAQDWSTVQEQRLCKVQPNNKRQTLSVHGSVNQTLQSDGCHDTSHSLDHLEHVQVHLRMITSRRGDLVILLTSPSGTTSKLLDRRPLDAFEGEFNHTFMTVHNWGENPAGVWTLSILDTAANMSNKDSSDSSDEGSDKKKGELVSWALWLYGVSGKRANHHEDAVISGGSAGNGEDAGKVETGGENSLREKKSRRVDSEDLKRMMKDEVKSSESVKITRRQGVENQKRKVSTGRDGRSDSGEVVTGNNKRGGGSEGGGNVEQRNERRGNVEGEGEGYVEGGVERRRKEESDVQYLRRLFEAEKRRMSEENGVKEKRENTENNGGMGLYADNRETVNKEQEYDNDQGWKNPEENFYPGFHREDSEGEYIVRAKYGRDAPGHYNPSIDRSVKRGLDSVEGPEGVRSERGVSSGDKTDVKERNFDDIHSEMEEKEKLNELKKVLREIRSMLMQP